MVRLATAHPLSGEKIIYLEDILELDIPECDECFLYKNMVKKQREVKNDIKK